MTRFIAGHSMTDTLHGSACTACGKTWLAMLGEREHWRVGAAGVAHQGLLAAHEVAELNAEVERLWASVKAAVEA